jgi:hypothetical protein
VPNPGQETIDDQMCSLVVHRAGPARTDDDESPRMGAGDLDGDGRAEMIVARGEQATVYSLDQAGVMRVVDEATVTSEGWIRVGDFTGDGHADVAFGEANGSHELGKITVYPGSGSASLGGSSVATDAAACFEGRFVSDVNNDDRDDMLTIAGGDVGSGYWAQDVAVALGQADGSFVVSTMYIGSSAYPTQTPSWVGFGDFDSDGVADLVQVFAGDELLGITPGLGDGTFGTTVASTIPGFISLGCAENCGGVARDGNGDGNIDVVLAGAEAAYVIPGDGAGGIGAPIESLLEGPTYNPHDGPSIVEDFTGDGVPDLLQAHGASDVNRIVYQIGLGSGSFGQGHAFTPAAFADGAPGPTVGDFDGDGHLDLGFVMRPQAEASLFVVLVNP